MLDEEVLRRNLEPRFRSDVEAFTALHLNKNGICVFSASKDNPFCGDTVTLALAIDLSSPHDSESPRIATLCWEGYGCSLCVASAEVLCEYIERHPSLDLGIPCQDEIIKLLGGISVSRNRIKCISLPLEALTEALSRAR
jgi:NifU-like protein involved in Fe-S cluster formation